MASIIDFSTLGIPPETTTESSSYVGALITIEPELPEFNSGAIATVPTGNYENTALLLREVRGLDEVGDYDFTDIQISRGLDQHPSATATFYSYSEPSVTIGSPVRLMEINFIISSYTITQYKTTVETAYSVTLSLTGEHAPRGAETPLHELDIPIRFSSGTTRISWGNIQSRLSTPISIGESAYTKYFATDTEVIVTPRAELEAALLLSNNQCLMYSDPTIRGVSLLTGIGSIEIDRIYILDETMEISVKEIPIYQNTELELEDIPGESTNEGEVTTRYEYENCTSFANLQHPGGSEGIVILSNFTDDLKDPGNVFDNGGRTKTARTIKEKDGNPLEVIEETWGYVFISSQLFVLPESGTNYDEMADNGGKWPLNFNAFDVGSVSNYWKQVEQTIILYYYDSDGYLTSSRKTGWKLGRLKRESGEYEAANLWINTFYNSATITTSPSTENGPPPEWKAKAREYNAYTFYNPIQYAGDNPVFPDINQFDSPPLFRYNIFERTGYLLADMADYYDDIEVPRGSAPNKFVYHTSSYSNVQELQPNPKDDPSDPASPYPPLIAHKERKDSSQTQIMIPESVGAEKKTPELFCTIDYSHSVEGDHSSSSIMIGNSTQYSGRPSVHTKLPDPDREGIDLPSGYANDRTYRYFLSSLPEEPVDTDNTPTALSSGGSTFNGPVPYSSVSFSGAVTPGDGKKAALNSLIKKSMDVHTTQIRVMFFRYYRVLKEGVKCTVDGQQYIITNISYNLKQLQDGLYYCPDEMTLSLSAIPTQSVSMSSYRRSDVNGSSRRSSIFSP
jgi:hypothetical protein